jgi:hypothetical protein
MVTRKKLGEMIENRRRIKAEWEYWVRQIGTGTKEQQINALKIEKESYKKLEEIEKELFKVDLSWYSKEKLIQNR